MKRAFTMLEAMVVLGMLGVVLTVASSTFVALMKNAAAGRYTLQAMQSTRVTLDVLLEYGRRAGGPDLPGGARVLIDKSGGQKNTDVVWLIEQAAGYGTCGITSVAGTRINLPIIQINGANRCCFEAGDDPAGTPPIAGSVPAGAPFRRTAVIAAPDGRFLPVFLEGDPTPSACSIEMKSLPGISRVVSTARGNMPDFALATIVLADVRRLYIDYDADGVRPPFGALFSQVEVDGDVTSFNGERQRLSSNAVDVRAAVGYDAVVPADEPDDTELDDETTDDGDDGTGTEEVAPGSAPLLEMVGEPRGWRETPVPVTGASAAPPIMVGFAIATGAKGEGLLRPQLPWSKRVLTLEQPVNFFPLVGRVLIRDGGLR